MKILKPEDVKLITNKMKIGDGLTFKYNLEKWRDENNFPSLDFKTIYKTRTFPTSSPSLMSSQSSEEMEIRANDILSNHINGRKIFEQYQETKLITDENRSKIINIICQYFDLNDLPMTLQTSYRLEKDILELFQLKK